MTTSRKVQFTLSTLSLCLLAACGSDSSDSNSNQNPVVPTTSFSGTLIVPQSVETVSKQINSKPKLARSNAECPNVPDGYQAMANATVSIETSDGVNLDETTTTDNCGVFTLKVTKEESALVNSVIHASLDGFKPLKANADNFVATENGSDTVASTIPSNANYVISAIQKADNSEISFAVTDSSTNNAVIQLSKNSFEVQLNDQPIQINTLNSADQLSVASSNVLTLDASGSMGAQIRDEAGNLVLDENDNVYNRFRITAKAAHQFVAEKSDFDEVLLVPFSYTINPINTEFLKTLQLKNDKGEQVDFDYSIDGFTVDKSKLHLGLDLYNLESVLWSSSKVDDHYPARNDTVVKADHYYPWDSGTELEEAIESSLNEINLKNNALKRVFVMTDGDSRFNDRAAVIKTANDNNVVIHSVAVSAQANETDLKEISAQTGGSYHKIIDEQTITGIYSSLQTTIKYAYVAELDTPLQAGDTLTLSLTINGEKVERVLTVQ